MAYSAKIIQTKRELDRVRVWVEFDNKKEVFQQDFAIESMDGLKEELRNRIARFESCEALEKNISLGSIDITKEKTAPVVETQEDIKKNNYQIKLSELRRKKSFVDLGILNDADISVLRSEVKQLAIELGEI